MTYELIIRDPDGSLEATFIPDLGMVSSSLRHAGEELFSQQGGPAAYSSRGSTFALPFLHPWANRLGAWSYAVEGGAVELEADDPLVHVDGATGLPIHGLLAASPHWQVIDADLDTVVAELDFAGVPGYLRDFPFAHHVRYAARVADGALSVTITVTATGELPVPISFGFHPYLTLPGSNRRDWEIALPVARQAVLDDQMIPTGEGVDLSPGVLDGPLGDRTFDTAFDALHDGAMGTPTFVVADDRRQLAVEFRAGYPVAQVFAPENSDFICFEPMTAPIDALRTGVGLRTVEPGESFNAEFAIAVR